MQTHPRRITALICFAHLVGAGAALAQQGSITGLGATSCMQFLSDIRQYPNAQREYFAWAQGYISGLTMGAPPGVDEGLHLIPPTFPLVEQAAFLRSYCSSQGNQDYPEAVHALFKQIRARQQPAELKGQ